jgi:pyruvate,orthophosphate dikinase
MKNMDKKYVYLFGPNKSDGDASMKELLGGKGANLAEMARIGIPVPPGFTISTEICTIYNEKGKDEVKKILEKTIKNSVEFVEKTVGMEFGNTENPLLFSVRSGARKSMPGMMDTVLNLGINDDIVKGLVEKTGNERFAWDSYRRFLQMYGDVVLGMKPESKDDGNPFEKIIEDMKEALAIKNDIEFKVEDLKVLVKKFKVLIKKSTGKEFPQDPWEQLWEAIAAVFDSWMNERAIIYRKLEKIPDWWGTAVNVQAMVFGNMGEDSATGVAFTRNAATGENKFNGEFLVNAQGEDVVAGIRTPQEITQEDSIEWAKRNNIVEGERIKRHPSLEELMPEVYRELYEVQEKLEQHYKDMQDLEFTVQEGKLWLLQTRTGKRTGQAMIKIAVDLLDEGIIDEMTVLDRIDINKIGELLHPVFSADSLKKAKVVTKGLPAAPGAAMGRVVFFADEVEKYDEAILVRLETSPEDIKGMTLANGFLTVRGGMTSHAAVVARGMGKCCVAGAGEIRVDYKKRIFEVDGRVFKEGEWISLNGRTGEVYEGKLETTEPQIGADFERVLKLADKIARVEVRANADTPVDAALALKFGAKGIGLCRTEHMFFEPDKIKAMREMILASDEKGREKALSKLLPLQRKDFEEIFEVMKGLPVTIRLLDPPLHEFLPHTKEKQEELALELHVKASKVRETVEHLKELNPMLGHRGCRLGNTYPEITVMQTKAIMEAAINVQNKGIDVFPEIMVPLVGTLEELKMQKLYIEKTIKNVFDQMGVRVKYKIGTMIEIPRAALTADEIAKHAEFFSFGTNDLTQMTFGYSRDDANKFLPIYLEKKILKKDPFQVLDRDGVGQLMKIAFEKAKGINQEIEIGICGEHGGEPSSIEFVSDIGFDYVSCSPYRLPIARVAAAKAAKE